MKEPFKNIVITGASSGIGRALAMELAGPDTTFLLIGRSHKRLAETAVDLGAKQAKTQIETVDVCEANMLAASVLKFDQTNPVDLVIANAGIAKGLQADRPVETLEQSSALIDTNLKGVMNTVQPLILPMRERATGQIAIMSSLAAIRPSGDLPTYSASKAALLAWGISLRRRLRTDGVTVSVITPGFIASPMSDRHKGPQPFRMTAEAAARQIAIGLRRKHARITVPKLAGWLLRLENLSPPALSDWIERKMAAEIIDPGQD